MFPTLRGATSHDMVSTVFSVLLPAQSAMRTDTESWLELSLLYDFCVANDVVVFRLPYTLHDL